MTHFAAAGFSNPALEEIAHAAGVTADQIVELFGNEEGLRQACDGDVLKALIGWARERPR